MTTGDQGEWGASLHRKHIWVIGGAGYLGSAITMALDAAGVNTHCLDLSGRAERLVTQHQLSRTIPHTFDVSDVEGQDSFVDRLIADHGIPDGVVNLAFASSSGRTLEQLTPGEFQATLTNALTPIFAVTRVLAERMKKRSRGSLVLFSSIYGVVAPDPRIYRQPMAPNPIDYGASKAAILQMARYFAVHYGPVGIRCNCVTPGPFPSPTIQSSQPAFIKDLENKTALRRIGSNSEIVGPALFLLSDSASYVTGHSLVVDGGWTAW